MTRKRFNMYRDIYNNGEGKRTLEECYKKPSIYKQNALKSCEEKQREFGNTSVGEILTYNHQVFTYGFYAYHHHKEYFVVITKYHITMREVQ